MSCQNPLTIRYEDSKDQTDITGGQYQNIVNQLKMSMFDDKFDVKLKGLPSFKTDLTKCRFQRKITKPYIRDEYGVKSSY